MLYQDTSVLLLPLHSVKTALITGLSNDFPLVVGKTKTQLSITALPYVKGCTERVIMRRPIPLEEVVAVQMSMSSALLKVNLPPYSKMPKSEKRYLN